MKVLLYVQNQKFFKPSGIGRALKQQGIALKLNGVDSTYSTKDSYDFVHINSIFTKSYHFMKKCQKNNIPFVVHGHSTIQDFRNSFRCWKLIAPFFNHMLLKMYRNADYIITPTPYSKSLIESYKGVKCPVKAISNGIVIEDYACDETKIKAFREHFNIKPNDKVVIGVGLLFQRKGLPDFIEVARKFPDVKFIWFGNLVHIATQHKILKAIKKRPSNVIMPGYISGDIIKGAFSSASMMFFPSYEETEGIVVLEALASKLPLIVRDVGVYNGWLKNGVNCLMGKTNDDFVKQIQYVFDHDNSLMVEKGYEVAKERSLDKIGKQLLETYEEVKNLKK